MSTGAIALTVAIIGLVGTVVGLLFKNSRSSPEQRTVDAQNWNLLNGGLQTEVTRLSAKSTEQDAKIAALEAEVAQVPGLRRSFHDAVTYIHMLIDQLRDQGHEPIKPQIGFEVPASETEPT